MTERIAGIIEESIRPKYGRIIGSFLFEELPDQELMPNAPDELLLAIKGLYLPVRNKMLGDRAGIKIVGETVAVSFEHVISSNIDIPIFGFDVFEELDAVDKSDVADMLSALKLGDKIFNFSPRIGTLAPLPKELEGVTQATELRLLSPPTETQAVATAAATPAAPQITSTPPQSCVALVRQMPVSIRESL